MEWRRERKTTSAKTREELSDIMNFIADHPGITYMEFYNLYGTQTNTPLPKMIEQLKHLLKAERIRKEGSMLFVNDIRNWKW